MYYIGQGSVLGQIDPERGGGSHGLQYCLLDPEGGDGAQPPRQQGRLWQEPSYRA